MDEGMKGLEAYDKWNPTVILCGVFFSTHCIVFFPRSAPVPLLGTASHAFRLSSDRPSSTASTSAGCAAPPPLRGPRRLLLMLLLPGAPPLLSPRRSASAPATIASSRRSASASVVRPRTGQGRLGVAEKNLGRPLGSCPSPAERKKAKVAHRRARGRVSVGPGWRGGTPATSGPGQKIEKPSG
ncbi:hypothetical protein U9M48_020885 [Paspalum notatum var. saurae]|uniref:Uncharacterized protein n=1 Tax=Paspalum notatum var. saurae TaxID=547442 RepID=A0AAQ3TFP7_PASNO